MHNWLLRLQYTVSGEEKSWLGALTLNYDCEDFSLHCESRRVAHGIQLIVNFKPILPVFISKAILERDFDSSEFESVYLNGFQSWTNSREYSFHERQKPMNRLFTHWIHKYKLRCYGDELLIQYGKKPGIFHSFTYSYLRNPDRMVLYGSVSEAAAYTVFRWDMANKKAYIEKDLFCEFPRRINLFNCVMLSGTDDEVFDAYAHTAGWNNTQKPCTGWTSWYNYYENISQEIILENLRNFQKTQIPIEIFQIDDGYQQAVGDWLTCNERFPDGMKFLADKIKDAGYVPGLWLAPFSAQKNSRLAQEHTDWLIRDENKQPIPAGSNWGGFYALDLYHPEVKQYLADVFHTVCHEWGYDFVKLDFLYSAALRQQKEKSRGAVMHDAMLFLREIISKKILGCGMPLGSGFGLVDYCRVSSDIGLVWEDSAQKLLNYKERVSTNNAVTSTIFRHHLNQRMFGNDPDVFILRDENQKMSFSQRQSVFLINQILGQLVFCSDNIADYSKEQKQIYMSQFPFLEKHSILISSDDDSKIIFFSISEKHYIAVFNLAEQEQHIEVPENLYYNQKTGFTKNSTVPLKAYESLCFLICDTKDFAIIGSENQLFPGSEASCELHKTAFTLSVHPQAQPGRLFIRLPKDLHTYTIQGCTYQAQDIDGLNFIAVDKTTHSTV